MRRLSPFLLLILVGCGQASREAAAPQAESKAVAAASMESQDGAAPALAEAPRAVIREGTISVLVADVGSAERAARGVFSRAGGYVETLEVQGKDGATLVGRVPEPRFDAVLTDLGALGETTARRATAEDVTEQIVDLGARMRAMRAEEAAYVEMLRNARRVPDALAVRERLGAVRQEIERADAARTSLSRRAAMSKVTVEIFARPPAPAKVTPVGWFARTVGDAGALLRDALRFFAGTAIYVAVLAPVWLPLAALVVWLRRRKRVD